MLTRHFRNTMLSLLLLAAGGMQAQNVQLHYDFGRNLYSDEEAGRQKVTMTLEQFKADEWGSWYYFVDVDFSRKFIESAYTEISREMNFGTGSPFALHLEYNGGLNRSMSFQHAALVGGAWNGHSADFSKTYSVQLMYKRFFKSYDSAPAYNSVQLTGVWGLTSTNKKYTFSGFIDFWRGQKADGHRQLVVLTEPQIWLNHNEHFSIGAEVEISNNFVYNWYSDKSFFVNPTLAVKWLF